MRYPLKMTVNLAHYVAKNRFRGTQKFPMVLMLEPLHACNLTCTGCGRIREYKSTINEMMTVEECLAASDECGAPMVSICGGEPMIYPEIGRLAKEILALHPQTVVEQIGIGDDDDIDRMRRLFEPGGGSEWFCRA